MRKIIFSLVFINSISASCEDRVLTSAEMARDAIILQVVNGKSYAGRYACSNAGNYACFGYYKAELGLNILMAGKDRESAKVMVGLAAVVLDSAVSEDYDCALFENKKNFLAFARKADAIALRMACLSDVARIKAAMHGVYDDVKDGSVCRSVDEIKYELANSIALLKYKSCDP